MAEIADGKQPRILLADDDEAVRAVLGSMLRRLKYRVVYACDGCDVVNLTAHESFDLILMDIQMHHMDGLTASLFVRMLEQKKRRRTPILAVTAHTSAEYIEKCLAAGIDAYLSKPVVLKDVVSLMEKLLGTGAGARCVAQSPDEAGAWTSFETLTSRSFLKRVPPDTSGSQ